MIELILQVFDWWLVLFLLGTLAMPFTAKLFSIFFDKGYAFTKTIGIIFISYSIFLLSTIHILQFNIFSLIILVVLVIGASIFYAKRWDFIKLLRQNWKIFLFEEIVFILGLILWSYIKSFQPDIHGLEKFMDFGFINSILRSTYFPPKDMWMTPLSINYYYFGHLVTAVITKLSLLPSNITFNLMLATLFASTFLGSFSIGANLVYFLKKPLQTSYKLKSSIIFAGLLSAFLVTFAGNLHTIYTFFTTYQNESPVPPTQLIFSPMTFPNQYWYPNATRFIYHTIHEFPIYSFVVSDIHGHVLDIPIVLLTLAILLTLFIKKRDKTKYLTTQSILLGSICAVMYMTNAWDGLIYLGVSIFLILFLTTQKTILDKFFSKEFFVGLLLLVTSFILVSLPFSFFFKPFASHVGLICAPDFLLKIGQIGPILFEKGYCEHSLLWQLLILYGFFFFWIISLFIFLYFKYRKKNLPAIDFAVLSIATIGIFIIFIPEFVYLKDIYTTYFRANTMFKLVYQAFILLSLVSGYSIYRILKGIRHKKILFLIFFLITFILLDLVCIYPYFAVNSYFNNLKNFQGLNGTNYLKKIDQNDYNAIIWLNKNIKNQPVILEAQGDSYTDYERVSSNTGLPTVFGWTVHEWLWRDSYAIAPPRIRDVKDMYETRDTVLTNNLLKKYKVSFVFIGSLEKSKYKIYEEKFNILGKVIYQSGNTKIYKLNF